MKHKVILTITSLLSILFFALHWADDIVRGMSPGGVSGLGGVLILVVWLVRNAGARGTAIGVRHHAPRVDRWVGCPCHPHEGSGTCRRQDANSSGVFFWVWTLIALGVTSTISIILSARGLWGLQRSHSR